MFVFGHPPLPRDITASVPLTFLPETIFLRSRLSCSSVPRARSCIRSVYQYLVTNYQNINIKTFQPSSDCIVNIGDSLFVTMGIIDQRILTTFLSKCFYIPRYPFSDAKFCPWRYSSPHSWFWCYPGYLLEMPWAWQPVWVQERVDLPAPENW